MITVANVVKLFDAYRQPVLALDDISLDIADREFVGVLGPSGCGKTTLLRLLAGLSLPTKGRISIYGRTPDQARLSREIAVVFQEPALLPWRTVRENVLLPAQVTRDARRSGEVDDLITLVGLQGFRDALPRTLSGGMQARAALARALTLKPRLLLMDEPFGQLDSITRERLQCDVAALWERRRCSVLFITHNVSEALFLADRVLVMTAYPGKLAFEVNVRFPRPRSKNLQTTDEFVRASTDLRQRLAE